MAIPLCTWLTFYLTEVDQTISRPFSSKSEHLGFEMSTHVLGLRKDRLPLTHIDLYPTSYKLQTIPVDIFVPYDLRNN